MLGDPFDDKYKVRSLVTWCKKESIDDNEKKVFLIELAFFLAFTLFDFLSFVPSFILSVVLYFFL